MEREKMTPTDNKLFNVLADLKTGQEVMHQKFGDFQKLCDERHDENSSKIDKLSGKQDEIYTDLKMFPYQIIEQHTRQLDAIEITHRRLGVAMFLLVVGGSFATLIKALML